MGRANSEMRDGRNFNLETRLKRIIRELPYAGRLRLKRYYLCGDVPVSNNGVDVVRATKDGNAKILFLGTQLCNSSWACPHCTPRKLKGFSNKINATISHYAKQGIKAYMLTFTIYHTRNDGAGIVLQRLKETFRAVNCTRGMSDRKIPLIQNLRRVGTITATECTYSSINGFHFHIHCLYFLKPGGESYLTEYAQKFTRLATNHFLKHYGGEEYTASTVARMYLSTNDDGTPRVIHSGDYICGYGLTEKSGGGEMSKIKGNDKTHDGRIYRSAQMFDLLESDNPRDQEKFIEYALATEGYARIRFSTHLANSVDIGAYIRELEDQKKTLQESSNMSIEPVCSFRSQDWIEICRRGVDDNINHKAEITQIALSGGNYKKIRRYCEAQKIPLPLPPLRKIIRWWKIAA